MIISKKRVSNDDGSNTEGVFTIEGYDMASYRESYEYAAELKYTAKAVCTDKSIEYVQELIKNLQYQIYYNMYGKLERDVYRIASCARYATREEMVKSIDHLLKKFEEIKEKYITIEDET